MMVPTDDVFDSSYGTVKYSQYIIMLRMTVSISISRRKHSTISSEQCLKSELQPKNEMDA